MLLPLGLVNAGLNPLILPRHFLCQEFIRDNFEDLITYLGLGDSVANSWYILGKLHQI